MDSLKAEKHRLFQQLKMVLHEEDEKRMKEVEQKQYVVWMMIIAKIHNAFQGIGKVGNCW